VKEIWTGIFVGTCPLHDESNDNGRCLINYAVHQHMFTGGTLFPHRNIHKETWLGPDDKTVNQRNHVIIDQPLLLNILVVRIHRGVNADSDQYLVIARLRFRILQRE
jgi:hypothetical protein